MLSVFRLSIFFICFTFTAVFASGQDLGSSNKLFGGAKKAPAAAKKPAKTPAKKQPVASKAKPAPKKAKPAPRKPSVTAKKAAETPKPPAKAAASQPVDQNRFKGKPSAAEGKKIEIVPERKREAVVRNDPATNALYEDLIDDGNTARDRRNYSAAEAAYKRASSLKPNDPRAIYGLGNLYSDQQRWEDAEAAYRKALGIDPNDANAHIALSYVLTQPIAAIDLSTRYEEAETLARKAARLAPSNALAFDQMGVALELRGLIDAETENSYRRAIQLNPTFAPAYAHLGRLLRRRSMARESAAAYENAIRYSNDAATMILVADVLQSEVRFAESEQLLRNAIADDPRNPSALILLGRALSAQGKLAEAESVLRQSLSISNNNFTANSLLGAVYLRQNKPELAENTLFQALRSAASYEKRTLAQQFELVGDAYMKASRRAQAERAYKQAMALDPEKGSLAGKISKVRQN